MAYDNKNGDGSYSQFNAGIAQMQRIHELQSRINDCNVNLKALNVEAGLNNYEVVFNSLNSLLNEVWPKLGKEEKEEAKKNKEAIQSFLDKVNLFVKSGVSGKVIVMEDKWILLRNAISNYELIVKTLLDAHKMNSPSEEGEGEWEY